MGKINAYDKIAIETRNGWKTEIKDMFTRITI